MFKKVSYAVVFTIAIPAFGLLVALWILGQYHDEVPRLVIVAACMAPDAELRSLCEEYGQLTILRNASIWTGVAALALMILYLALSRICGRNRALNASIFPRLVPFSVFVIGVLILVEGAILTYAAYIGEIYAIERVHYFLIGGIGIGALVASLKMIASMVSIKADVRHTAAAKKVTPETAPKLWEFVSRLSGEVQAKTPDNVIVGLDPNFYATGADVTLVNEGAKLTGETLYLSLPLMRLFSADELKAVIAHELAHFKGSDTAYTLRFAPVYRGLSKSLNTLSDAEGGLSSIAALPAAAMLSLMLELFSRNERAISRDREFEADSSAASVTSPEALATSLGKVAVYSGLWSSTTESNISRLNEGKITANLSRVFEDSARFDVSHQAISELVGEILTYRISHPTDTHPTISERYQNIGFDQGSLTVSALRERGNASSDLFEDLHEIEEELTLFEHRLMVAIGRVSPPEEGHESNLLLNAVYALAAAMVGADGRIEQSEVGVAESIGSQMFQDFDSVEFRERCNNLAELPPFREVVDILSAPLDDDHKLRTYKYLKEIALADNDLADEEEQLLHYARTAWVIVEAE